MENQINIDDKNAQQIGQNIDNQPGQISEKLKVNYWMITTLVLAAMFIGILSMYVSSKTNQPGSNITPTQPPIFDPNGYSPTTAQKQNLEVFIQLKKTTYQNNDKVFEPVKYSLVNNSSKTIYFLSGCAVVVPEVYKIQDGQKTKLQKSAILCEAMPRVNQVSSGGKIELGWNQQNLGKFVEDGQYLLAVEYSFDKAGDYGIGSKLEVISDIFAIRQIVWDLNKQKQICELYGAGFHSNDFFYSNQDCLERLK